MLCSSACPRPVPRDQRDVAAAQRLALLQHVDLGLAQDRDGVRHRLEIVQQRNAAEPEIGGDAPRLDAPRHVGQLRGVVDHRTGDAEAGLVDRLGTGPAVLQKRGDHRAQVVEVERAVGSDERRARPRRRRIEHAEQGLGAADVARKDHGR
jgi:hypothetical protein